MLRSLCREAFNIVVLFWLFCGTLLLLLTQTVLEDEAAVQRAVREALADSTFDPRSADAGPTAGAGSGAF